MSETNFFKPPKGEDEHHKYHTAIEKQVHPKISNFKEFIHDQITASIFLVISAIIAVAWASFDQIAAYYQHLQDFHLGLELGKLSFNSNLKFFVNDILMTFFFFLLGLEIKREFLVGELKNNSIRNTVVAAALGGVIAPAVIFLCLSQTEYDARGWGIPVATDTAFALGILALFKNRVPESLFAFVAALAVIDDLVAILILAIFYTPEIHIDLLGYAAGFVIMLISFNLVGIRNYIPYLVVGSIIWFLIEHAGIHGTFAGVLVAMTIPARPRSGPRKFIRKVENLAHELEEYEQNKNTSVLEDQNKHEIIEKIEDLAHNASVPLARLQHKLEPTVLLMILPIFALLNAGIPFSFEAITSALSHNLAQSLFVGLLVGKCIGISTATWFICKLKLGQLPTGTQFGHIFSVSILAGIGFTMSIFIAELAFGHLDEIIIAKSGIFVASILASLLGVIAMQLFLTTQSRNNRGDGRTT